MHEQHLIIVAGGTGSRMGGNVPKQFLRLGEMPVIIKTLNCFLRYNPAMHIVICVHKDYLNYLDDLITASKITGNIKIAAGGDTRFQSVKNGLALLNGVDGIVGIHDAARPFVSNHTIKSCYETAAAKGNAVPVVEMTESLRNVENEENYAVNRSHFKIVQTPQCFRVTELKQAFECNYSPAFTDDASVFEAAGGKINLVAGNTENIKITTPRDLEIAKYFIEHE